MFTGIVQAKGSIASLVPTQAGVRLTVNRHGWKPAGGLEINHGDSICVSGVCLTVTAFTDQTLSFDVIPETLAMTKLGKLGQGDSVNLEPSVTAATPMGGHFVQGHVDGLGVVSSISQDQGQWRVTVTPPAALMEYIIPKGSITLDGVSLTIASVTRDSFDVALIPTTLNLTTLASLKQGDVLNVETDILSRTIVHHLKRMTEKVTSTGLTMETLIQAGFAR
jgi:riboflavin synthase alpha subunit